MASQVIDSRPDPDALLGAARREGRGKLKIFLGAAPGVGKTYEMLTQARAIVNRSALGGYTEVTGRRARQSVSRANLSFGKIPGGSPFHSDFNDFNGRHFGGITAR